MIADRVNKERLIENLRRDQLSMRLPNMPQFVYDFAERFSTLATILNRSKLLVTRAEGLLVLKALLLQYRDQPVYFQEKRTNVAAVILHHLKRVLIEGNPYWGSELYEELQKDEVLIRLIVGRDNRPDTQSIN